LGGKKKAKKEYLNRECTKRGYMCLETCPLYGRTKKLVKSIRRAFQWIFSFVTQQNEKLNINK
jgi:hypothetical protein